MATYTNNLELVKPELNDLVSPTVFADNFDKIDAAYGDLNSNLSKKDVGTLINIISYTNANNPFICPSDGYICVYAKGINKVIEITNVANLYLTVTAISTEFTSTVQSLYVRKGSAFYVSKNTGASDKKTEAYFCPLV